MSSSNLTSNPNRVEGSTYAEHERIYSEWQRNMATVIEQVEDNERRRLCQVWVDYETVAELSRTKQRNVELESELVAANHKIDQLTSWIKAANQFAWAHDCPAGRDGGSACTCGLDQFLGRPKPFIESYKQQVAELEESIQKLQKDLASVRQTCAENYDWWKTAESNIYALKHRIAELEGDNANLRRQLAEKPNSEAKSA